METERELEEDRKVSAEPIKAYTQKGTHRWHGSSDRHRGFVRQAEMFEKRERK
jgi:hypothetical protein